jgi:hypothetical protein
MYLLLYFLVYLQIYRSAAYSMSGRCVARCLLLTHPLYADETSFLFLLCLPVSSLSSSWIYTGLAYGEQSRELAEALWRDREFEPLDRFSANEAGRQSHQAYIACLLRWGYIRWHLDARKGTSKIQWALEEERRAAPLDDEAVAALYYGE